MKEYTIERYEHDCKLDEIKQNYLNYKITEYGCKNCRCFDNNWCCPPFDDDILSIWDNYDNIRLIMYKYNFTDEFLSIKRDYNEFIQYGFDLIHGQKKVVEDELYSLEKVLNGVFLTSGPCVNCRVCQRSINNRCVMPDKRKYSMESLGADVISIAKNYFNLDLEWIRENKKPHYLIMMLSVLF